MLVHTYCISVVSDNLGALDSYYYNISVLLIILVITVNIGNMYLKVRIFWEGHKNLAHLLPFLHYLVAPNSKWKMGQIVVAFSEHLNFTYNDLN